MFRKSSNNRFSRLVSLLLLIVTVFLTGCNSSFPVTPINYKESDKNVKTSVQSTKKNEKNNNNNKISNDNSNVNSDHKGKVNLDTVKVNENGKYQSKYEVAAYIKKFGKLPSNYIKKNEAMKKGWDAQKGNLWKVTDKMSIGGDNFGNFEKKLPEEKGLKYFECDIDYEGGRRNAKRIIYSNKGDIYYTEDHYNTFEKLN